MFARFSLDPCFIRGASPRKQELDLTLANPGLMQAAVMLGICLAGTLPQARAESISLQPAEYLQAGGAELDLDAHAIPCVADWNSDGHKDLIVGYRYADKVAVFYNAGTDGQPAFTTFTNLQAGGMDIYHPGISGCAAPAPWVCDYDADGRRDLLVGTGAEGYVYFYRNTNTDAAPRLAPGVVLQAHGATLSVGQRATPYVHDWDEDGLPDLLCGNGGGLVYFFKNLGSLQLPVYGDPGFIQAGVGNANFGSRSAIRVFDWDGDGRKDLVGSGAYFAGWCRNIGSNPSPVLEAPIALQSPVSGIGLTPINTGYRMRLELVDWDNDGVTDLLIGQHDGRISWYAGYHFRIDQIAHGAGGQCVLSWSSAPFLKFDILTGPTPKTLANRLATNLPSQGSRTCWTNQVQSSSCFFRVQCVP